MVDDVKDITEKAESKEALDRARLARERREAEQRKRLDELRAHAAAAQAQREKRDEDRRKRQAEQRARDDDRRIQEVISENTGPITNGKVEERKRAIWEASISRREALLQRERDRTERLERARAARSAPRPAFAFGSSTPRLLEPVDSAGFFWAARRAASTTNVMYASAPLTRRASALHLDTSDTDNKDEADRSPQAVMWTSVARRRTDLVPTVPAPRAPGRAYSMTRLDKLPTTRPLHSASPSMHHLNRTQTRSGDTTPGSRPGSAMSNATGVVRRATSAPRKPRPASIAGTGCNTPRGEAGGLSAASTPAVSRDASTVARPASTPRRPRPLSLHVTSKPVAPLGPGEGKPPMHRKPKPAKDQDKSRGKSLSASPGRTLSPSPAHTKESSIDKELSKSMTSSERHIDAHEVTQKLEALQVGDGAATRQNAIENKENLEANMVTNVVHNVVHENRTEVKIETKQEQRETQKETQRETQKEIQKPETKKESSVEKAEETDMTASMISRRITTEEEAKAALAERRRRAREEFERQAELERLRAQREAEEEAERQRLDEERQRREEEEARELAALQRRMEEEKLKKAIEAQQQLERDEAERKVREELERQARLREEGDKRRAAEEAERTRREELEREERERLARKQRVEAIMARTRLKKQAEEDKKKQDQEQKPPVQNQNVETQNSQQPAQPDTPKKLEQLVQEAKPTEGLIETKVVESGNVIDTKVTESGNVIDTKVTESGNVIVTKVTESGAAVDTKVTESGNVIDTNVTESGSVDTKVTESGSVVDTKVTESVSVAPALDTIKVADPNISGFVNASVPNVSESVNVAELAKDGAGGVTDNGNVQTADLLSLATSQPEGNSVRESANHVPVLGWESNSVTNNGNLTADLLGLSDNNHSQDTSGEQSIVKQVDNGHTETSNGNVVASAGHITASFLHSERLSEHSQKEKLPEDFATHNGHGAVPHPLTLQNAI